ncbi:MAG: alpha-glucuronidase family glycosyl hydrolase [Bryobacteraceae bacterium]
MKSLFHAALIAIALAAPLSAENGYQAWLPYKPIQDPNVRELYRDFPASVVILDSSPVLKSAQAELLRAIRGMLGRIERIDTAVPNENCILLATLAEARQTLNDPGLPQSLPEDGFLLKHSAVHGHNVTLVTAENDRGVLYGTLALLRKINLHQPLSALNEQQVPSAPIRWTNEWNNLDGSIERGYGGRSIFFENGSVMPDLTRVADYARLLASIGINGCTVNNVNANPRVLSSDFLPQLARLADAMRPWGIRMSIAVDFSSPKTVGPLDTFDPLDPKVAQWWKDKADEIYRAIPDLGGFLLKADSEGRVGPSAYGRTHADAANVIARALKPQGGVLVYRGFVYNHHLDWHDLKNDRAKAAYDNFAKLDGKFDDNVLVQIKYGPIDFQVREPVSPLLGALPHTNELLELQVTQEYTGQQRQLCFLLPMWKEILDFDLHANGSANTPVKNIVAGSTFHRRLGGFVGVVNVGRDDNWMGSDLAMANLYAFGRIAWNTSLPAAQVIDEWTQQTFGDNPLVTDTINDLQLQSWRIYEDYTGPLGVGGLTDITGPHYGPGIESAERNGWGQWIRADAQGIGMDRSVATGTGYIGQYSPTVAAEYETLAKTADNLILFMHHVKYTYMLHSGKTVIQHVYDSHYRGAAAAGEYPQLWRRLRGHVDQERFDAVLAMLEYQAAYAIVWRDAVCNWFFRESQIPDVKGRVGHHPHRIEGEDMQLTGYTVQDVTPWEDASGGKAIVCSGVSCTAEVTFKGPAGWYDVGTQYFDLHDGASRFSVFDGDQLLGEWKADLILPSSKIDAHNSTRHIIRNVALRTGDHMRVVGVPNGGEHAAVDYVEITPHDVAAIQ